jgi:putative transposase
MVRGDGGKTLFETDDDRKSFLFRLGHVCGSHGWRVHAWVLMDNHFHLPLEMPRANPVTGMQWLMGTRSQGWNRASLTNSFRVNVLTKSANCESNDPSYLRQTAAMRMLWYWRWHGTRNWNPERSLRFCSVI